MKLNKWEEEIFFSTVCLSVEDDQGEDTSVGTGFFVGVPAINAAGDDQGTVVLVSSRHVFEEAQRPFTLKFHRMNVDGTGPELGSFVRLKEDFSEHFVTHPNPDVDLACVGVVGLRHRRDIFFRYAGPGTLADFTEGDLYAGKSISFVGYPNGLIDWSNNLPLMRFGYISTMPKVDFRGKPEFLVDAPTYEGSSGSAVYSVIDGDYRIIGVLTRSFYKEDQASFGGVKINYHHYLGLGLVLKSTLIRELIDHMIASRLPDSWLKTPQ